MIEPGIQVSHRLGRRARARRWPALAFAVAVIALTASSAWAATWQGFAELVMDASTGQVLHERDADQMRPPASLTKLMTLYLIFEAVTQKRITFQARWAVSEKAANEPPTKLGLYNFDYITVQIGRAHV